MLRRPNVTNVASCFSSPGMLTLQVLAFDVLTFFITGLYHIVTAQKVDYD